MGPAYYRGYSLLLLQTALQTTLLAQTVTDWVWTLQTDLRTSSWHLALTAVYVTC
jgi:hypothetical protein